MKKLYYLPVLLLLILNACKEKSSIQEKKSIITEKDRETLTYLKEVEWPKAYREQDTVLLDRILNDDFEIIRKLVNKRSYTNYFSETTKQIYIGTVDGLFVYDEQLGKYEINK